MAEAEKAGQKSRKIIRMAFISLGAFTASGAVAYSTVYMYIGRSYAQSDIQDEAKNTGAHLEYHIGELDKSAYVAFEPILVNISGEAKHNHLRIVLQLEVNKNDVEAILHIKPRLIDVVNTYIRSVRPKDLEAPNALENIRQDLILRMEIAAGYALVRDVLIMEFILS